MKKVKSKGKGKRKRNVSGKGKRNAATGVSHELNLSDRQSEIPDARKAAIDKILSSDRYVVFADFDESNNFSIHTDGFESNPHLLLWLLNKIFFDLRNPLYQRIQKSLHEEDKAQAQAKAERAADVDEQGHGEEQESEGDSSADESEGVDDASDTGGEETAEGDNEDRADIIPLHEVSNDPEAVGKQERRGGDTDANSGDSDDHEQSGRDPHKSSRPLTQEEKLDRLFELFKDKLS